MPAQPPAIGHCRCTRTARLWLAVLLVRRFPCVLAKEGWSLPSDHDGSLTSSSTAWMACHGRQRQTLSGEEQTILDGIAPIAMTRFNGRSLQELCVMGGFTREEFTRSVADREIDGQGRQEGRRQGRQQEVASRANWIWPCASAAAVAGHTPEQVARVRALPLERLED